MNEWIEQYKQYHADQNTNYPGNNLKPQLHHILDLIQDMKPETLLDFGCGKGTPLDTLSSEWMNIYSYDPIMHPIELPEAVDLVYSRDVLEHIEPEQIDTVLENLFTIGTKYQHHFDIMWKSFRHRFRLFLAPFSNVFAAVFDRFGFDCFRH